MASLKIHCRVTGLRSGFEADILSKNDIVITSTSRTISLDKVKYVYFNINIKIIMAVIKFYFIDGGTVMKKMFLVLLAAGVCAGSVFAAETIDTIMNRKSVRTFERSKIERKDMDVILKAGMAAPSARNIQPWAFVVINDFKILDELAKGLPYAKMLRQAGAAIVVCGKEDKELFWITDCSAATQNILLAVEDLGLGAVWTAVFPDDNKVNFVRNFLNIPEEYVPLNVIPIGKPAGDEKPKNKYDANKIHVNKW